MRKIHSDPPPSVTLLRTTDRALWCACTRLGSLVTPYKITPCASALIVLSLATGPAWGIVTSDQAGSHVVQPGESAFGVDVDGVVILGGLGFEGDPVGTCSGALITDRHVLSAAHCFDEDGNGEVDPLRPSRMR